MAGSKNSSNLDVARTVAREAFTDVYHSLAPSPVVEALCGEYSTGAEIDNLSFGAGLNAIREWLGAKEYGSVEFFKQTVNLTKYERSLPLPRTLVEYDPGGQVATTLRAWIEETLASADDKIVFDILTASSGGGPTGFDGVSLINDSHTFGSQTHDNKVTTALSPANYDAAYQLMTAYKSAAGEPLNIVPDTIIVGPKLRKTALDIAVNARLLQGMAADGTLDTGTRIATAAIDNVYQGDQLRVIVWRRLVSTQDDYWYLVDTSKTSKALALKRERAYELIEMTDMDSPARFSHDEYEWSVEGDLTVAAGAPPVILGGIVS